MHAAVGNEDCLAYNTVVDDGAKRSNRGFDLGYFDAHSDVLRRNRRTDPDTTSGCPDLSIEMT
jgi:hypothetical protein